MTKAFWLADMRCDGSGRGGVLGIKRPNASTVEDLPVIRGCLSNDVEAGTDTGTGF